MMEPQVDEAIEIAASAPKTGVIVLVEQAKSQPKGVFCWLPPMYAASPVIYHCVCVPSKYFRTMIR